ncbi:MAG: S8 family serine peptidase [Planctomycetia bacterium]|jgi:hypothetical protein
MPSKSGYPERISRFEQFESRYLLSANPLVPEALATPAELTTSSTIMPLSAPDLLDVDYTTASDPIGIQYVRDHYDLDGLGQTVVIIDTGLAYNHPAFTNNDGTSRVVGGYDFAENDNDPYDEGYHGTHVAGILAADDPNVAGLAPDVDLVVLRVFDDNGNSEFEWVENAMQWVLDHQYDFANPITTVNISLGALLTDQTAEDCASLEDELASLESAGIFTAVAAGNQFTSMQTVGLSFPASSEYVVPVASVDGDGGLSFFSQRDAQVIAAPGRSIVSTVPDKFGDGDGLDDDYAMFSGTSMATPYVSGAAVLLREALADVGVEDVDQDLLYDLMYSTGDFVYDQVTGQSYCSLNLARAVATVYTSYTAPVDQDPVDEDPVDQDPVDQDPVDTGQTTTETVNWGTVSDATFADVAITSGSARFQFTAARDGLMSVLLSTTATEVRLLDANENEVSSFTASGRADLEVLGGQQYILEVSTGVQTSDTTNDTLSARLVNLVSVTGSSVSIVGTEADDQFAATVGASGFEVSINGVDYTFATTKIKKVHFDGLWGMDQATLTGSAGKDSAEVHVDYASMVGEGYEFSTVGTEVHHLFGGGGTDMVVMYDSAGDDQFSASVGDVTLAGEGFTTRATGFARAMARSTAGGNDSALFYDSADNDTFVATMDYAKMTGTGFYNRAEGFSDVKAVSSTGGKDTAYLSDSAGNDTLTAVPHLVTIAGTNFRFQAEDFRYVLAYSREGGTDRAVLHDSAKNDRVQAEPDFVKIANEDFYQNVYGFATVEVHADAGGEDTAWLYDSPGDDMFEASENGTRMTGDGFQNTLYGFESVSASASAGGYDSAVLRGGAGSETLLLNGIQMQLLGSSYKYRAAEFDYCYAEAGGGQDKAIVIADAGPDSSTDGHLTCTIESLRLVNERMAADLYNFEHIKAYAAKTATHESKADAIDYLLELFGEWVEK